MNKLQHTRHLETSKENSVESIELSGIVKSPLRGSLPSHASETSHDNRPFNKKQCYNCSNYCVFSNATKERIIRYVSKYFEKFGYLVYDHSWKFILIPTIICTLLSLGLYNRVPEFDMDVLYSLPVSTTTIAQENLLQTFPIERLTYILLVSKTGENLLTKTALTELDQMWNKLTHLNIPRTMIKQGAEPQDVSIRKYLSETESSLLKYEPDFVVGRTNVRDQYPFGNETFFMFGDVCRRTAFNTCTVMTPLDLYLFPSLRGNPITMYDYPNFINIKTRMMYRADSLLGGIEKTFDPATNVTRVTSVTSFALRLTLLGGPEFSDQSATWEQGAIGFLQAFELPSMDIYVRCERSINDELARSSSLTGQDLLLLLIASVCVSSFTVFMNSSLDWYRTKTIPALCGVSTTVLAYGATVGLMYSLGMKHVPPSEATPFMMLGICVDDVFVIINAYALTYVYVDNPRRRIGLSIRDSGVSITITTLTNVIAFCVGSLSPYYSISVFCVLTAFGLFVGYVLCLTVFLGVLAVFARYEQLRPDLQGKICLVKQRPFYEEMHYSRPFDSPPTAATVNQSIVNLKKRYYQTCHNEEESTILEKYQDHFQQQKYINDGFTSLLDKTREALITTSLSKGTEMEEEEAISPDISSTEKNYSESSISNVEPKTDITTLDTNVFVRSQKDTHGKKRITSKQDDNAYENTSARFTDEMLLSNNLRTSRSDVADISNLNLSKGCYKTKQTDHSAAGNKLNECVNEETLILSKNTQKEIDYYRKHSLSNNLLNESGHFTRINCFNSQIPLIKNKNLVLSSSKVGSLTGNSTSVNDNENLKKSNGFPNDLYIYQSTYPYTVEIKQNKKHLFSDSREKNKGIMNSSCSKGYDTVTMCDTATSIVYGFYVVQDLDNYTLTSHNVERHLSGNEVQACFSSQGNILNCWYCIQRSFLIIYFKLQNGLLFRNTKKTVSRQEDNPLFSSTDKLQNASILSSSVDGTIAIKASKDKQLFACPNNEKMKNHYTDKKEDEKQEERSIFGAPKQQGQQQRFKENTIIKRSESKFSKKKKNVEGESLETSDCNSKKKENVTTEITTSDEVVHSIVLDKLPLIYYLQHPLQETRKRNDWDNNDNQQKNNFVYYPNGLPSEPKGNVGNLARSFFMYYGPCLLNPITKIFVILFFILLTIVSAYYTLQLDTGLQLRDVTPYSSYLRDFYDVRESFFSNYGDECILFFSAQNRIQQKNNKQNNIVMASNNGGESDLIESDPLITNEKTIRGSGDEEKGIGMYEWWDSNVKHDLIDLNKFLESSPNIVYVMNGFMYFYDYVEKEKKDISTKESFMNALVLWLQTTEGKVLSSNFIIRDNELIAWKIHYWMHFVDNTGILIRWIEDVRKFLNTKMKNGYLPHGHVYTPLAIHWETDLTIVKTTITNMVVALVAMSTIVFLLIRDIVAAMIILLDIIFIDLAVIGTMPLLSLKLNMLTMVNLVLSIGFAVDYTTHITHCFTHCKGKSRNRRALESLCCIGFPITEGMITTYLAVGVLATSKKYVLVVVFRMMTCVLIYASMHGIIFIPLILSLIGPMHHNPVQVVSVQDQGIITSYWNIDPRTGEVLKQEKSVFNNNVFEKSTVYVALDA